MERPSLLPVSSSLTPGELALLQSIRDQRRRQEPDLTSAVLLREAIALGLRLLAEEAEESR